VEVAYDVIKSSPKKFATKNNKALTLEYIVPTAVVDVTAADDY
jgi:hypothetical protein